jgi:hypothetical protein
MDKSDSTRPGPLVFIRPRPSLKKRQPQRSAGAADIESGRKLANSLHHLNRVSTNSLDRLVTRRGEVSPSLRFVEGLCLLKTIPFVSPTRFGRQRLEIMTAL